LLNNKNSSPAQDGGRADLGRFLFHPVLSKIPVRGWASSLPAPARLPADFPSRKIFILRVAFCAGIFIVRSFKKNFDEQSN
jgi:hypothetical protein